MFSVLTVLTAGAGAMVGALKKALAVNNVRKVCVRNKRKGAKGDVDVWLFRASICAGVANEQIGVLAVPGGIIHTVQHHTSEHITHAQSLCW